MSYDEKAHLSCKHSQIIQCLEKQICLGKIQIGECFSQFVVHQQSSLFVLEDKHSSQKLALDLMGAVFQ